jgi:predicted DCC family thiol-disulfide oxidoreductase YuxK
MSSDDARVIVFDGHCNICSGWVRFMASHPTTPPFRLVPMQSEEGRLLLTAHGIDPDDPATFLVLDADMALQASDGAIHVIAVLGGLWRAVRLARWVPRPWRDALYRLLARNRYRWFGRRAVCYLPERH